MESLIWVANEASEISSSYDTLKTFINNAKEMLINEAKAMNSSWIIETTPDNPFLIIGDLHGDFETLKNILKRINHLRLLKRELNLVFLGDYIDRGPFQVETLVTVLKLKIEFPENVLIIRGNHEPPRNIIPYPHDFPEVLRRKFGYSNGVELYNDLMDLFEYLPLVIHVKREAVMLHGGLPTETYKKEVTIHEYFTGKTPLEKERVLAELLWNDPFEANMVRAPSPRGIGYLFGRPVTEWVLKRFRVKAVFRGHEAVDRGFKLNHGGKVMTLFSRLGPPYYNSRAAYAVIDMNVDRWWQRLRHFVVTISL